MKMTLKLLFMLNLWLGATNLNNAKHLKRNKQRMPVAWHPTRWWDWCMSENEIKEIKPFLIDEKQYKVVSIVTDIRFKNVQ